MKNTIKITLLLIVIFTLTVPAFAQEITLEERKSPSSIPAIKKIRKEKYGAKELGYNTKDTLEKENIRNEIIKNVLGFIGIFFLILVISGGYQWMSAGGNEEIIGKAKKRIINATIGLIIVLVAYILTNFIIDALFETTIQE